MVDEFKPPCICKVYKFMVNLGLKENDLLVYAFMYKQAHENDFKPFELSIKIIAQMFMIHNLYVIASIEFLVARGFVDRIQTDNTHPDQYTIKEQEY